MNLKPIKHIKIKKGEKASNIVKNMADCGFGAKHLNQATEILEQAIKDKDCKVFLGLAGALVPGGMKEIIIEMLEKNYIDVLVTTGANLTHDLIEALGFEHFIGTEKLNDKELNKKGIDRIYNVFMKNKVYVKMEDFFTKNFNSLSKTKSPKEFLWKLGSLIKKRSILKTCYKKRIPIFCPALTDSGIGLMIWGQKIRKKKEKINLDFFSDIDDIIEEAWQSKKTAVFYLGGGVPKNFIQQTMQFTKPASYGIQITTDRPEPGGSSGAPLKEGISWGKMSAKAKFIDIFCDVTIALPLIHAALKDRIKK